MTEDTTTNINLVKNSENTKTQNINKVYVSPKGNDTNSGSKNSPKATINNAITTVKAGGTIYLKSGTYKESKIEINKNVNIIGENTTNTIINSQNKHAITITSHATLQSFTIKNATDKNGGAIYNKGILKLKNMKIQSSNATIYGGAIYNEGRLTANKTIFTDNNANYGGAIYDTNKTLLINCSFTKNYAKMGSSILATSYTNIQECNFTKNHNTPVYIKQTDETYIKSSIFTSNNGTTGGAICNKLSKLNINNVTFTQNYAKVSGGAIYNTGTTTIKNSLFNSNNATLSGGAVYNTEKLTLKNNTFNKNRAQNGGAAYTKTDQEITINITNSNFTNNIAKTGGAIFVFNKTILNLKNSVFQSNQNNSIYIKTGTDGNNVYNSTFIKNNATYGGAIRNAYTHLTIRKSIFAKNRAKYGSTLFNVGGNVTLKHNILKDNAKDIYNKATVNADYNWWGSNTINKTRTYNTKINNWIYLTMNSNQSVHENENTTTTVSLNNVYNGKKIIKHNVENKLPYFEISVNTDGCGINNQSITINQSQYALVNNFTKAGFAVITAKLDYEKLVNKITVHNDDKNDRITGVYVQLRYGVTSGTVKKWVKAGVTDVYVQTQASTDNTQQLKHVLALCKDTNIRVHGWVICFRNKNGKFDVSTTQQNKIKNFIKKFIQIEGVDGVSLDYVRYSGLNPSIVNQKTITNFVKSVHSLVKGYDENLIVSASVFAEKGGTVKYYGQNYTALSPYLDVILPMTYRYSYSASRNWLKEATQYVVDRAPYSKVVSVVQTYYENLNKIPVKELELDIKAGINGGSEGYVLFREGLISSHPPSADKL